MRHAPTTVIRRPVEVRPLQAVTAIDALASTGGRITTTAGILRVSPDLVRSSCGDDVIRQYWAAVAQWRRIRAVSATLEVERAGEHAAVALSRNWPSRLGRSRDVDWFVSLGPALLEELTAGIVASIGAGLVDHRLDRRAEANGLRSAG